MPPGWHQIHKLFLKDQDMKILITGADGQLGHELKALLEKEHPEIALVCVDKDQLDITSRSAVEDFLAGQEFTHVVNCAAYTAVDKAEEEKALCRAVNVDGPANLGRLAEEMGYRVVHISTDYVFDGNSPLPYTEAQVPRPLSVYGESKRRGETALLGAAPESLIIRTSWLYSPYNKNFVKTMLNQASKGSGRLGVVYDQTGAPTSAQDLARAIRDIILGKVWVGGIFHFTSRGVTTWYDFALSIFELAGIDPAPEVTPLRSSEYPTAAQRPAYSVLDCSRITATYGIKPPHWRKALAEQMPRILKEIIA